MPLPKTLWSAVTCFIACLPAAEARFLGVRDNDQGEAGSRGGPPAGPPTVVPPGHGPPTDAGNGRRPTSYWTFWPSSTTAPLTAITPATSSLPTESTTVVSITSSAVVSRSTINAPIDSSSSLGLSSSIESSVISQLPASSAGSATTTTMPPSTSDSPAASVSTSEGASGMGSNHTLTITLSTVLSVVGVALAVGALICCLRKRKKRLPFFARGISPIDDDEIATWKTSRDEKAALARAGAAAGTRARGSSIYTTRNPSIGKSASTASIRKPPSVIVYQGRHSQQLPRPSGEGSPRSIHHGSPGSTGRMSFDKEVAVEPIQAVAPNARAGLTDETVPGDDPFLPSPKRHPSRLSKVPPNMTSPRGHHNHTRTRSSRSSMRSWGGDYNYYTGSDMELSPRTSNDYYNNNMHHGHSRVYSSSSIPPRLSFGDDGVAGGLSPRPLFRENDMIGRAIG